MLCQCSYNGDYDMKRTPMKPRKAHINHYSKARIQKFYDEFPERIALAERCGGEAFIYYEVFNPYKQEPVYIPRVRCIGGICEICGKSADGEILEPHESPRRSKGGLVSLKDSVMCHRACHNGEHPGVKLEWLR